MESLNINSLPPGFGFHPTDEELTSHYLKRKVSGQKVDSKLIPVVEIYKHEPWDLPEKCPIPTRDGQWHFFAPRDRKYPNSFRQNRATGAGYWKSTGKDRNIKSHNKVLGTKKTLVFHEGRPPNGKRTEWIMHEFYIDESGYKDAPQSKDTFVLCRVTKRDGWTSQRTGLALEVREASVQIGEGNHVEKPEDAPDLAVHMQPSGPSDDMFDVDAYLESLPPISVAEFITEPNHEIENLQEVLGSVAPKQELAYSQREQGEADEFNFMSKEDNIDSILEFNPEDIDLFDGIDIVALAAEIIPPTSLLESKSRVVRSNFHENEMDGSSMLSDAGFTSELNGSGDTMPVTEGEIAYRSCMPFGAQLDQGEADEFDFLSKEDIDSIFQFNSDNFGIYNGLDMEALADEITPPSNSHAASNTFDFESKSLANKSSGFSMLSDGGFTSSELNGTSDTGIVIRQNPRSYRSSSALEASSTPSCKLQVSRAGARKLNASRPENEAFEVSKENGHFDPDEDHNKDIVSGPTEENSYPSDAESDSGSLASDTSQESVITTSGTPRKSETSIDRTFNNEGETHRVSRTISKPAGPSYLYLSVFVIALAVFVYFLLHKTPAPAFLSQSLNF